MVDVGALSDIESRRLAEQGNLLYYSTSDYFVVKAGMSIRDQLDCRRELEEGFFKEWQARRFLTVFPRSEKELNKFQAQMDASMAEWDWDVQLLVASVINLKNFKRSAKKRDQFYGCLFTIEDEHHNEIDCQVNYENGQSEILLFCYSDKDEIEQYCEEVFHKLTKKRSSAEIIPS